MSNFIFYYESIDDATVTYSATADTNYPTTNLQDRNINTFFKDSPGVGSVSITIDFGSGNARAADSLILGNYIAQSGAHPVLELEWSTDNFSTSTSVFSGQSIGSASLTDYLNTFNSVSAKRYWRLTLSDSQAGSVDTLQIGTIYLGTKFTLASNPIVGETIERGYNIASSESEAGTRYTQARHTTKRRRWEYEVEYFDEAERTNWESFADTVFVSEKGLSRYPFYWTDDGGTTLYYARYIGPLSIEHTAYQAYTKSLELEEEL